MHPARPIVRGWRLILAAALATSCAPPATPAAPRGAAAEPGTDHAASEAAAPDDPELRRLSVDEASQLEAASNRRRPEEIQRTIRASMKTMRACYEGGLRKDAELTGRIVVRMRIEASGAVSLAEEAPATTPGHGEDPAASAQVPAMPDADVRACVVKVFAGLEFPPADGVSQVTYPINFSPH